MSLQLIDNASQWHKMWSVRLALAGAVLNAAAVGWTLFQGAVNPLVFASVNMGLGIAVAIARVVQQTELQDGPHDH
ncbi:hypothetical protein [Pseudomonas sp. dw_358]|uniref:DUF7940 domain-containing protein n=1 Tax=Pseudomonas sp. dw_358 TaxID=2720083 RepID=UPI001BD60EC4|nr:hypothetical protein [Pseudomonas sp. dw_358]